MIRADFRRARSRSVNASQVRTVRAASDSTKGSRRVPAGFGAPSAVDAARACGPRAPYSEPRRARPRSVALLAPVAAAKECSAGCVRSTAARCGSAGWLRRARVATRRRASGASRTTRVTRGSAAAATAAGCPDPAVGECAVAGASACPDDRGSAGLELVTGGGAVAGCAAATVASPERPAGAAVSARTAGTSTGLAGTARGGRRSNGST